MPDAAHILIKHPGVPALRRAEKFLSIWEVERCKMIEMSCDLHDKYAANSQFITHLTGRILGQQGLQSTPIDTRGEQDAVEWRQIYLRLGCDIKENRLVRYPS